MTEELPTCPTVAAVRAILYANPGEMDPAAQQITGAEQLQAFLALKGVSLEGCDHLAMARLVRDFFMDVTEDDLLAAVGGEFFIGKVVIGGVVAGASAVAVGGGIGAAVAATGH